VYVKLMETLTRKASDLMALTAMQILTVACLAGASIAVITPEHLTMEQLRQGVSDNMANLAYLGVFATAAIIALQTWGQRHSSANEAAIVYAFEPACAAIAAYFWLAETMTSRSVFGGFLLILGMIVSQWAPRQRRSVAFASNG
jgi:drug/metabolite transporter (DMT)-like permease